MKLFFVLIFLFLFHIGKSGIPSSVLQVQDLSLVFSEYKHDLDAVIQEFSLKTGISCHVVSNYILTETSTGEIKSALATDGISGLIIVLNKQRSGGKDGYFVDLFLDEKYQDKITTSDLDYARLNVFQAVLNNEYNTQNFGENLKYYMSVDLGLEYLKKIIFGKNSNPSVLLSGSQLACMNCYSVLFQNHQCEIAVGLLNSIKSCYAEGKNSNSLCYVDPRYVPPTRNSSYKVSINNICFDITLSYSTMSKGLSGNDRLMLNLGKLKYSGDGVEIGEKNFDESFLEIKVLGDSKEYQWNILRTYLFTQEELPITDEPTIPITVEILRSIFPTTPTQRLEQVAAAINHYSDKFEINTIERMAHFLGQIGAETGGLRALSEDYCYSSNGIKNTFPGAKFCDLYEGYDCLDSTTCPNNGLSACNPAMKRSTDRSKLKIKQKYLCSTTLFDYVYACRMGNGAPSSREGSAFRGTGFIHLTGKDNFEDITESWNDDPDNLNDQKNFALTTAEGGDIDELREDIDVSIKASLYYWSNNNLNDYADIGMDETSIKNVGSLINYGRTDRTPNGAEERFRYTTLAYNTLQQQ